MSSPSDLVCGWAPPEVQFYLVSLTDGSHTVFTLDEPRGNKSTHGYATGGWVAAPVVGQLVRRIGPLAGIRPYEDELPSVRRDLDINRAPGKSTLASY